MRLLPIFESKTDDTRLSVEAITKLLENVVKNDAKSLDTIGGTTYYHGSNSKSTSSSPFDTDIIYLAKTEEAAREYGRKITRYELRTEKEYDVNKLGHDGYITDENGEVYKDEDGEPVNVGWLDANMDVVEDLINRGYDSVSDTDTFHVVFYQDLIIPKEKAIAEAYYEAKKNGDNQELIAEVERLLNL